MVRENLIQTKDPRPKTLDLRYPQAAWLLQFWILVIVWSFSLQALAAEEKVSSEKPSEIAVEAKPPSPSNRLTTKLLEESYQGDKGEVRSLAMKLMIVNPSKTFKQTHHLKQLLPPEIEPRHVIGKGEMSIGYDANEKAYYVSQDIELDPGQSVVKVIKVEDVWLISEDRLKEISAEASELYERLVGTPYEEKARFLLNNLEVLLGQILELQNDESLTAEEHIQIFRSNKEKLREAELDLTLLRRLIVSASGDAGSMSLRDGEMAASQVFLGRNLENTSKKSEKGAIPAWVAWRVIFIILIFLCIASTAFYLSWARQMRILEKRRRETLKSQQEPTKTEEKIGFDDILTHEKESSI